MDPTVVAAWIAAGVSVLTLVGTLAAQYLSYRAASRDAEKTAANAEKMAEKTAEEQRKQLDRTLAEQREHQDVLRGVAGAPGAAATALTGLRRRLGRARLSCCSRWSPGRCRRGGSRGRTRAGCLLAAWDGTTLKLPASEENKAWARGTGPGGHYPRARLVALAACGSRGLIAAAAGPWATGERALAGDLTRHLRAGMLLLADRGFYSWGLWHAAAATGADLAWRVHGGMHLPVARELPDGSWVTRVDDPYQKRLRASRKFKDRVRRRDRPPETGPLPGALTARVIEFTVTVTAGDGPPAPPATGS